MDIKDDIIKHFPKIEFSYEIVSHKKIPSRYNLCIAVPDAKRYIFWATIYRNEPVSLLLELNRDKQISNVSFIDTCLNTSELSLGTILSGYLLVAPEKQLFVIDEIYTYAGLNLKKEVFNVRLGYIHKILRIHKFGPQKSFLFFLPVFWNSRDNNDITSDIPYTMYNIGH